MVGVLQHIVMASLSCLLQDLIEDLVVNQVPTVKRGFSKLLARLVQKLGAEGIEDFLPPEKSNVSIKYCSGGVKIADC